jgi:hypothetical protein
MGMKSSGLQTDLTSVCRQKVCKYTANSALHVQASQKLQSYS